MKAVLAVGHFAFTRAPPRKGESGRPMTYRLPAVRVNAALGRLIQGRAICVRIRSNIERLLLERMADVAPKTQQTEGVVAFQRALSFARKGNEFLRRPSTRGRDNFSFF